MQADVGRFSARVSLVLVLLSGGKEWGLDDSVLTVENRDRDRGRMRRQTHASLVVIMNSHAQEVLLV